jgi:ABC-type spermidine/putrescine transport system permease subunit II
MILRFIRHALAVLLLTGMLAPLAYAAWVSFSPGELLQPPTGAWSLRWYHRFFDSPQWMDSLWNSLEVAGMAVAVALLTGTGLALAATRYHFRGRRLLSGAVLLPLFVPAAVLGMGLLPLAHIIGLWGSPLGLALAHGLIGQPVVFLVVRSALEEASPDLELAARGLGAGPWPAFRRVTLPLIRPAVVSGALMSFILSLNEFALALFLGTREDETLPRVIWPNLRYSLSPLVAVASCVTIAVTVVGFTLAAGLWRLDRLFRKGR